MLSVIKLFLTSNNTDIQHAMLPQLMCELYSLLNEEYTLELEKCDTKPFCIRLFEKDNEWCWSVTCFGRKAYENIILPLTDRKFSSFVLPGSNDMRISITRKNVFKQSVDSLIEESVLGKSPYRFTLQFIAPTVFKNNDRFVFFPDIYLMYESLLDRSQLVSDKISFADKETFEELVRATSITAYDIKTSRCILDHERTTGFIGRVTFRIDGPELMRGYAKMLFRLGEFTGIGEGGTQGLGAIFLEKEEGRHGQYTEKNNS